MKSPTFRNLWIVALVTLPAFGAAAAGNLTLEDRVSCQEAIERVYYLHQIGTTLPFEQAVPREVLERKVRTYLQQSVALEEIWHTPVTAEALRMELERIAVNTRFPERLEEIYAALNQDPFLIQECFARPALVDRLARSFFAFDRRIHAGARAEAEALHEELVDGSLSPYAEDPRRSVAELVRSTGEEAGGVGGTAGPGRLLQPRERPRLTLPPEEYDRERGRAPREIGEIGPVDESRDDLNFRVVLEDGSGRARIATYAIPKLSWAAWWGETGEGLDPFAAGAVASSACPLPRPADGSTGHPDPAASGPPPDGSCLNTVSRSAAAPSCRPDDTWQGMGGFSRETRVYHATVWTGSEMIVWGGTKRWGGEFLRTGARYNPVTDTWTPTSTTNAPLIRALPAAVWTGHEMIVWGDDWFGTGGRYDPASDTWTPTSTANVPPSGMYAAVWTGNQMIVWGVANWVNTGGRYDPATDSWSAVSAENAPQSGGLQRLFWTGTEMIVWGGTLGGRYDPATDSWRSISGVNAPQSVWGDPPVWTGSEMIVWAAGGRTGGRYDPTADVWTPMSAAGAPSARFNHTAVWTGSEMIVWGGEIFEDPYITRVFNTGGRYDPVSDSWTSTSTENAPSPRCFHAGVWTGSLMIIWGGQEDLRWPTDTGGRYDPATDSWTPTATAEVPSARSGHTAIWTGSEMIVWGGDFEAGRAGGKYNPLLDSWTPTTPVNAPEPWSGRTAVWTGREMIVWGEPAAGLKVGGRYNPFTDTWRDIAPTDEILAFSLPTAVWTGSEMILWGAGGGGRYDPATDTWRRTSTVNAPEPRFEHTAVWTGEEMIVWGGTDYVSRIFGTGGRYKPTADTWTPTSTADSPSPKMSHAAVWTGSEMIVWGGGSVRGGRYDPVTDSWTPVSTTDAPSGRSRPAAWTGHEMVVWGGGSIQGGRYNPATDSWSPVSTADAPSPRSRETAVWTGSDMIVWGGSGENGDLSDGGRYALGHSTDDDGDGLSECAGDCNDADPGTRPGAREICDCRDNDCDGVIDEGCDADSDGIVDCMDNCPETANPDQRDADGDGLGDSCDPCPNDRFNDQDGDGACDDIDNCLDLPNADQADADQDGRGDACDSCPQDPRNDEDGDGVCGDVDNCPTVWNDVQSDSDGDGVGDDCDACPADPSNDADKDGICGASDNCPATFNPGQEDEDGDGMGDACDPCPQSPIDGNDDDGDGFSECTGDCDDARAEVHPGAAEVCDNLDNDCDGLIDEVVLGITCPADVSVECGIPGPSLGQPVISPGCSPVGGPGNDAPSAFGLGTTIVTWTVSDEGGGSARCEQRVGSVDTTPPALTLLADPQVLWPPNHSLVPVSLAWQATDLCDPSPAVSLVSVTSSEPDDAPGTGDGDTVGDVEGLEPGTPDRAIWLRAERSGSGPGRVYELTYRATDASGNSVPARGVVTVPHDLGQGPEPLVMWLSPNGPPGAVRIDWAAIAGAVGYDVITGDLAQARVGNRTLSLGAVKVLARETTWTSHSEGPGAPMPLPGGTSYYLIQARTPAGGGFGTESAPWPRLPESCDGGCP